MAAGRSPDPRTLTVTLTTGSTVVTATAGSFDSRDVGRQVTGGGVPAGTTIAAVASPTSATLSAAATITGTSSITLAASTAPAFGFLGWAPETSVEAASHTIAGGGGATAPSRITSPSQRVEYRTRD